MMLLPKCQYLDFTSDMRELQIRERCRRRLVQVGNAGAGWCTSNRDTTLV